MLAFIEDLKKEFSEAFEKERDYQVTKEDLEKMFRILNKHVFRNDFDKDKVVVDVIDYNPSIKVYGKFGLSRDEKHIPMILIVRHSSDRFSQIVSVLCHEMIHMYDFKHGTLGLKYDEYGDIDVRRIEGREYVHGYHVHGDFFKTWIAFSKKRANVTVKVIYNTHSTKKLIMADIETRVKEIIVEQLGVDPAEVVPGASFINDLGADSLDKLGSHLFVSFFAVSNSSGYILLKSLFV